MEDMILARSTATVMCAALLLGCSPTVKIQAPEKPIEINLNVKIEQDVRVHVEKEVDNLARQKPDVF
jgi:hypothetical protein